MHRTADRFVFFDDHDVEAATCEQPSRVQAGGARADDDDVVHLLWSFPRRQIDVNDALTNRSELAPVDLPRPTQRDPEREQHEPQVQPEGLCSSLRVRFTPILNANTWRDILSASRVSRTTSALIGGTVIGCTSRVFNVSRPSRDPHSLHTRHEFSKRLRCFRATSLLRCHSSLPSSPRRAHAAQVRRREPPSKSVSQRRSGRQFVLVVERHQPDLSICRKV